ncbi:MAG: hypothetical protein AAF677_17540 [Pseudomonadota bacterium]
MNDVLHATATIDAGQVLAAAMAAGQLIVRRQPQRWRFWTTTGLVALPAAVIGGASAIDPTAGIAAALANGVALFVFQRSTRRQQRRILTAGLAAMELPARAQIVLGPDGIVWRCGSYRVEAGWTSYLGAADTPHGLALVFGMGAFPVPDAALPQGWTRASVQALAARYAPDREHATGAEAAF